MIRKLRYLPRMVRTYRNPVVRVADYLGLLPKGRRLRVHLRNGLVMRVRSGTSDFGVLDDIFLRGVYNRALDRLQPGDTAADVGAQSGGFALAAAGKGADVICFEPIQENCEMLRENARLNGLEDRIAVHQVAVAGANGRREVHRPPGDTGGATLFPSLHSDWEHRPVHRVQVDCVTLHHVIACCGAKACACLKLDCEGAEFEIIASASPDDLQSVRTIIMEFHPNGDPRTIVQRLEASGFDVEASQAPAVIYATRDQR